jgi:hypothetical protein
MLDMCSEFGLECDIIFNHNKLFLLQIGLNVLKLYFRNCLFVPTYIQTDSENLNSFLVC